MNTERNIIRNIISNMIDKYNNSKYRLYLFDRADQISPAIKEHIMFNEWSVQYVNSGNEWLYIESPVSKLPNPYLDKYDISKFTGMFITEDNKERIINLIDILRETGELQFRILKDMNDKYSILMSWDQSKRFNMGEQDISFIKKIIDEKINAKLRDDTHTQKFYDSTFLIEDPEYFYNHFEEEVEKIFIRNRYCRCDIEIICKKAKDINAHFKDKPFACVDDFLSPFEENVEETFKYDSEEEDIISKPKHYMLSGGLEVKNVVEMIINNQNSNLNKYQSHMKAVILEYLMRAENKNGLEDYKKAGQWLVWLIESLEGETK